MDVTITTVGVIAISVGLIHLAKQLHRQTTHETLTDETNPTLVELPFDHWKSIKGVVFHVFTNSVKYTVKGIPDTYYDRMVEVTFTVPRIDISRVAAEDLVKRNKISISSFEQTQNVTLESILSRECQLFGYIIADPCPITKEVSLQG